MTVYGTRPEAIKVAPVIAAVSADSRFESIVVVTGQHREMLDQVNEIFEIVPDVDLDVFGHGQSLSGIAAKILSRLAPVLADLRPDAVIVQGDTTTSTAAALAAFYAGVPVVHLEAGLRSGDITSPFPEEANRKITSQIAALHLAPTAESKANLVGESVDPTTIAITGNTVIDALLTTAEGNHPFLDDAVEAATASGRPVLLVTTHRRESWGPAMEGVGRALRRIADAYPEYLVVLPLHRNPVVRDAVLPPLVGATNIVVTEPLAYGEFTRLLRASRIVLTDSGGVQEEAPSLGKPVLVMRENTERPEAVTAGTVLLIGTDEDRIVLEVGRLITDDAHFESMSSAINPYGDGEASGRTVAAVAQLLGVGVRLDDFAA